MTPTEKGGSQDEDYGQNQDRQGPSEAFLFCLSRAVLRQAPGQP